MSRYNPVTGFVERKVRCSYRNVNRNWWLISAKVNKSNSVSGIVHIGYAIFFPESMINKHVRIKVEVVK